MPDVYRASAWIVGLMLAAAMVQAHAAKEEARCLVLGPLAVSGYVALMEKVAAKEQSAVADRAANATDLIELYDRVGCSMPALNAAIECVSAALIDPKTQQLTTQTIQRCMREAGMPVR